eukprot:7391334-Prymnesium_polylepis.1
MVSGNHDGVVEAAKSVRAQTTNCSSVDYESRVAAHRTETRAYALQDRRLVERICGLVVHVVLLRVQRHCEQN